MAEELDIRSIWNKSKSREPQAVLPEDLLERKGTKNTLYWIKTILTIEFWLCIVMMPATYFYASHRGDETWMIVTYEIICLLYLVYYQFLIRAIKRFNYDGNVVQSLKKIYRYLRIFLLHYKIVIWLSIIIGLLYGYYAPETQEAVKTSHSPSDTIFLIAFLIIFMSMIGGAMQLLVHLIYGKKIKRLKRMVMEFEREE
ncbi:MAG: hypothetical protein Tsb0034_15480 [Ekhidna sp.]